MHKNQNTKYRIVKPKMRALVHIKKIREYLDYVEEHIVNVGKAWEEFQNACYNHRALSDDSFFWSLHHDVEMHDISKLSAEEFIQYQQKFYPVEGLDPEKTQHEFEKAWINHYTENGHHWQNWTKIEGGHPDTQFMYMIHMVIDWLAMGYKFGDTPREYYERSKEQIDLPDWAEPRLNEIFDMLEAGRESS